MFEESSVGSALSRKATLLMAEILQKANRVLPLSIAAKIQVRGPIYEDATQIVTGIFAGASTRVQPSVRLRRKRAQDSRVLSAVRH